MTGTRDSPGTVTITLNDPAALAAFPSSEPLTDPHAHDSQRTLLTESGTYAFDVQIDRVPTSESVEWLPSIRSVTLGIPQWMPDPIVDEEGARRPGHNMDGWSTDDDPYRYYASYYLQGQQDASAMKIDCIGPGDLSTLATRSGDTQQGEPHLDLDLYEPTENDPTGTYRGVFTATDSSRVLNRDHRNRNTLSVNRELYHPAARNYRTANAGFPSADVSANFWQKRSGYDAKSVGPIYTAAEFEVTMQAATIVSSFGHGDGTRGGGGMIQTGKDVLIANHAPNSNGGTALADLHPGSLSHLRFLLLLHCSSAGNDPTFGNLLTTAVQKGCESAAGFTGFVAYDYGREFSEMAWSALCRGTIDDDGVLSPPVGITDALANASYLFGVAHGSSVFPDGTPADFSNYSVIPQGSNLKIAKIAGIKHGRKSYRPAP